MSQIAISEAAIRLNELVDESRAGREVILTRNSQPVAKIVPLTTSKPQPRRGSGKNFVRFIAPDFDATPEGFEEYMP